MADLHDEETLPVATDPPPSESKELPVVDAESYDLIRELGRGGMGRVLVARDRRLRRDLALKISLGTDETTRMRFAREAMLTARLQHPAIVPVHEAGTWAKAGQPFYAMKLVDGRSLSELVDNTQTLDERLALIPNVIAVVDALAFAHSRGIIHRDLKPGNVIVGDYGETIVIDWGLAKELGEHELVSEESVTSGDQTALGQAMGTPPYMSPEQAEGERVDERTDVYGLGAMLYHVLSGAPPYRGIEVLGQVLAGPPRPLVERAPAVPRDLLTIVDKAMARDKAQRYPNAGALGEDLKRFFRGQLVGAHVYSTWELVLRWLRKHRAMVSVVTLAVVVLAAISVIGLRRIVRERNTANAIAHELVVETGRSQLELGHHVPAAKALAKAYADGDRDPATLVMLAAALRPLDAEVARYDAGSRVRVLAYTADGATIVSLGERALLWDVATGTSRVLDTGGALARDLAVHGNRVALALGDRTVAVFDARTGARQITLKGVHPNGVRQVRFSPDGTRILTAGALDSWIALWNAVDGSLIVKHELGPAALAFANDRFFTLDSDGTYHQLTEPGDIESERKRLAGLSNALVEFFPDGRFVVAAFQGHISIWSPTGELLGYQITPVGTRIEALAVSADRIVVGGNGFAMRYASYYGADRRVHLDVRHAAIGALRLRVDAKRKVQAVAFVGDMIAVADGATVRTFDAYLDDYTGAPFTSRDDDGEITELVVAGARLVSIGFGRYAAVSDGHGSPLWRLEGAMRTAAVAGNRLATAGFGNEIRIWNLAAEPVRDVAHTIANPLASFAYDGRFAILDDGHVRVGSRTFGDGVLAATFAPDGRALVTMHGDDQPRLWSADGTLLRLFEAGNNDYATATFLLGGARVLGASLPGPMNLARFEVWDVASGLLVAAREEHGSDFPPTVSADGRRFATFGRVTTVWDAETVTPLARFEGENVYAAISPDGARVAVGNPDGTTQIYAVATKQLISTLTGHAAAIKYVDYTSDRIVTASGDGTARIWKGTQAITLAGHRGQVTIAKLSPDGLLVATGGDDGTLRIWDARDGRQLLVQDNGAPVFAVGWSPASDAVFASTMIPGARDGAGRAAVWSLAREAREPRAIERVLTGR